MGSDQSSQSSRREREERERARWNNYREATSSIATAREVETALEKQRKLYEEKVKEVVKEQEKKLRLQQQDLNKPVINVKLTTAAKQPTPSTSTAIKAPSTSAATARDVENALEQQRKLYEQKMKDLMNEQQKKLEQQNLHILILKERNKDNEANATTKQQQPPATATLHSKSMETSSAPQPLLSTPIVNDNNYCTLATSSQSGSLYTAFNNHQSDLKNTANNSHSPGTLYPHLSAVSGHTGPFKPCSPITHGENYNAPAGTYAKNPFINTQRVSQLAQSPTFVPSAPPSDASSDAWLKSRSRSQSRHRGQDDDVKCKTCKKMFGERIYQCNQGHSSCQLCKLRQVSCGQCGSQITDRRNIDVEKYVAERKVKCPNSADGCRLHIKMADMTEHEKICPFKPIQCPSLGFCRWNGKISQLAKHFEDMHQMHLQAEVDKEMVISNIYDTSHTMHYIRIGPFNFLVHVVVSDAEHRIYMAVQLVGTKQSAAKWDYEIHMYKKNEPRRKYQYIDKCLPASEPIQNILKDSKCAVIPLQYATSFICGGIVTYKFYIKKNEMEGTNKKDFAKKEDGPRTNYKKNYAKKN